MKDGEFPCRLAFLAWGTQAPRGPGPPSTLGNMRERDVHHLIAFCLNDACRHQALIDVSNYPGRDRGAVVQKPGEVRRP